MVGLHQTQINSFVVKVVNMTWLNHNMENIEHGRPIEFIRHRRESQGYRKVTDDSGYRSYTTIERVDTRTEIE